ncbi:uncharacterized protein LOC111278825 [Durio zibethinus]|uniref:Uncharacterized protein LOC111278825 n=1 Tax=Durio zibethinus TaxID=66656 RepID=A0A6P5WYP0_DURZI|nr:uncharacterized protein LOC111278825 [Durio zibethinus]
MATEQCERPVEKTFHEKSHEKLSTGDQIQVRKELVQAKTKSVSQMHGHNLGPDMTKTHAESKTQSRGTHAQQHPAQGSMAMTCHGKKEKKTKEKKEKKPESKKQPEKEKSKHKKKCKDSSSDSD